MKRQFGIFLVVSIILVLLGLSVTSQAIAKLTLFFPTSIEGSSTKIMLSPTDDSNITLTPRQYHLVAQDAQRVVAKRLNQMQLDGYYSVKVNDNRLEVIVPQTENMGYILNVITQVGDVEFIDAGSDSAPVGNYLRTEFQLTMREANDYQVLFTGNEIKTITPPNSTNGEIFYQVELEPAAAQRVSNFVGRNPNAYVCLTIDEQVLNCSTMYYWSENTLEILPNLSSGSGLGLADMAIFLNSGPLPVSLKAQIN